MGGGVEEGVEEQQPWHEAAFRRAANIKFDQPAALLSPRVQSRE